MSKSLASRLSSPQEFVDRCPARLSFDPFADEDPDNYPECRHRPAVEQVDYILAKDKADAARRRRLAKQAANPPPLVPRRKPLPPPIPIAKGLTLRERIARRPLADRLTEPLGPPVKKPDLSKIRFHPYDTQTARRSAPDIPDFGRKNHSESIAIVRPKVNTVLTRISALWDPRFKEFLETKVPERDRLALQTFTDRLEAIARFLEAPHSRKWLSVEFHEILRVCKRFELITLANLKKNYATICTEIYEQFVYTRSLDWAA